MTVCTGVFTHNRVNKTCYEGHKREMLVSVRKQIREMRETNRTTKASLHIAVQIFLQAHCSPK
jgi:hypothetical protein